MSTDMLRRLINCRFIIIIKATARVHPIHVMNMAQHQAAADPQTRPNDPGCESACRLPETTPTIAIYYYYSAQKHNDTITLIDIF